MKDILKVSTLKVTTREQEKLSMIPGEKSTSLKLCQNHSFSHHPLSSTGETSGSPSHLAPESSKRVPRCVFSLENISGGCLNLVTLCLRFGFTMPHTTGDKTNHPPKDSKILRFCMFPAFLCFLLCFPALFNQHYQQELPSDAPEQVLSMFCLFFVCCLSLLCFVTCSMRHGKTSQASKPSILSLNSEAA